MIYQVEIHRRVLKRLKSIQRKHRQQIIRQIRELGDNPRPQDSIKLKSPLEGYRITIGEYRALYTIDAEAQIVFVYLVIQRGEDYPD